MRRWLRNFQFVWYGWRPGSHWARYFIQQPATDDGLFGPNRVYLWRVAIGPLDIRRWTLPPPAPRAAEETER